MSRGETNDDKALPNRLAGPFWLIYFIVVA
jgi:hypothetical protein